MRSVLVIGGGIGGLTAAYRMREEAVKRGESVLVTVLEAGPRWGGVICSSQRDGFIWEHGPDSILRVKPAGMRLIEDLGLMDQVQATEPSARSSLIARGRRLIPVPEGLYLLAPGRFLPFIMSPIISWPGKLRMALDLVLPRRRADHGDESLASFVRRRLGNEAFERIAQPLIGGIYSADPEQLSLAATMPQFIEMERAHRSLLLAMRQRAQDQTVASASGPRYGLFVSLRGGLQTLTDRLVARLENDPACVLRVNASVQTLARDGKGYVATPAQGAPIYADQVVVALPAHAASPVLRGIDQVLAYLLATIPYAGIATVNIACRIEQISRLPQAAGFVVPAVEGRALLACTIAHNKYAGRAPANTVLLRAFVGGALQERLLDQDDAALTAMVLADLRELLGLLGDPLFVHVHRWPKAMAQYVLGHLDRVQAIRARERHFPGLALIGNGYEGVGIPDIIAQADSAATRLFAPPSAQVIDAISREVTA